MVSKYFQLMVSAGTTEMPSKANGILPYVLAFLSSVIWPLAWIYSNEHSVNMAETTMIRGMTSLVANYLICLCTKSDLTFQSASTFRTILLRSLILSLSSCFIGASQFILPLSIVHTIISSSVLFVFIIDFWVNGVRVNLKQGVGITIGMIGMVLASNGRLISTLINPDYREESNFVNYITDSTYAIVLFTIAFIVVIALWSYAFVLTKKLKCNAFQINYFLGLTSLFSGSLLLQFLPQEPHPHAITNDYNPAQFYRAVLFTGVPLLFDQWFLIAAVIMCREAGIVAMMSFNSIIIGYLISVFRYQERPNMFVNVGIALLAIGMYQTLFNMTQPDAEIESVSGGEDNEDGSFRKGIHRSMHQKASLDSEDLRMEGKAGPEVISTSVIMLRRENSNSD